jgi:hypothetical protein
MYDFQYKPNTENLKISVNEIANKIISGQSYLPEKAYSFNLAGTVDIKLRMTKDSLFLVKTKHRFKQTAYIIPFRESCFNLIKLFEEILVFNETLIAGHKKIHAWSCDQLFEALLHIFLVMNWVCNPTHRSVPEVKQFLDKFWHETPGSKNVNLAMMSLFAKKNMEELFKIEKNFFEQLNYYFFNHVFRCLGFNGYIIV